jgi:hypothetical protein
MVHPVLAALPTRPIVLPPSRPKVELEKHSDEFFFVDNLTREPIRRCVGFASYLRGVKGAHAKEPFGCFANLNVMKRWVMTNARELEEGLATKLIDWIDHCAPGGVKVQPAPSPKDLIVFGGNLGHVEYHRAYKHVGAPKELERCAFDEWKKRTAAIASVASPPSGARPFNLHRHLLEEAKRPLNQGSILPYRLCYYPPLSMFFIERLHTSLGESELMAVELEKVLRERYNISYTLPRRDALEAGEREATVILPDLSTTTYKRAVEQLGGQIKAASFTELANVAVAEEVDDEMVIPEPPLPPPAKKAPRTRPTGEGGPRKRTKKVEIDVGSTTTSAPSPQTVAPAHT